MINYACRKANDPEIRKEQSKISDKEKDFHRRSQAENQLRDDGQRISWPDTGAYSSAVRNGIDFQETHRGIRKSPGRVIPVNYLP